MKRQERTVEKDVVKTMRTLSRSLLRVVTLFTLLEGPKHGYEILKELNKKVAGLWKPSQGSIYPILEDLENQGYLIAEEERFGAKVRRTYWLTGRGKTFIALLVRKLLEGIANGLELDALDAYLVANLNRLKEIDPEITEMVFEYLKNKIERLKRLLRSLELNEA